MAGTLGREVISTRQRKIAELARREPKLTLTTLAHHIDEVWMREAYRRIRKDAAAGVDGVTAAQYEADLEANLTGLLERFKSGRYRAPAVRRVHLEKPGTSKTRPIGIPTLEDKILQRAVLMVMEAVYEQDFLDCSYGFRPGRGAHQALQALWDGLMKLGGGWVIDLDIEDFFGSVDWGHLRGFLDRRVRDGVIRRAIGKWLNAGVMEAGELSYPQRGTPQGGVVSPTLSNVYGPRHAARIGGLASARQYLSALCSGFVVSQEVAQDGSRGRGTHRALCGRFRPRVPIQAGCGAVCTGPARADGVIRA